MNRRLSALLMVLFGGGCQTNAGLTPNQLPPTHMLRLHCGAGDEYRFQSRIAVLDMDDPVYDYGFSTGHGVPPERPCTVKDFEGGSQLVNFIYFADDYLPGEKTDWAILRFDKISTRGLVRYKLKPIEDLTLLKETQFYFAQARGLSENAQTCKLSILDFGKGRERVTHDCKSISGQSGSPITYVVDREHRLVGLNIGHLWMHQSPETNRPDRKGYINLLDQDTIDEIEAVVSANRS